MFEAGVVQCESGVHATVDTYLPPPASSAGHGMRLGREVHVHRICFYRHTPAPGLFCSDFVSRGHVGRDIDLRRELPPRVFPS
jgi:hypothetical protein